MRERKEKMLKKNNGFTLVEFLVLVLTIAVMGLICTAIFFGYKGCMKLSGEVKEKGAKVVIEEFWEGPQKEE
jgi:competence protein ComGC